MLWREKSICIISESRSFSICLRGFLYTMEQRRISLTFLLLWGLFSVSGGQLLTSYITSNETETCCSSNPTPVIIRSTINETHNQCQCVLEGSLSIVSDRARSFTLVQYVISFLIVMSLLVGSGFCSGLNVGLMSLGLEDLQIIADTSDSKKERRYAEKVLGIRKEGNILLVAILLGNVCINSILSLFLDSLVGSGTLAVAISTLTIVIFGEIVPQAICLRHALFFGYIFRYPTRLLIILTAPLSYPLGMLLNRIIGDPSIDSTIKTRNGLSKMVHRISENVITSQEVSMVEGIIASKPKTLGDIALPIKQLRTLPMSSSEITPDKALGDGGIILLSDEESNVAGYVTLRDVLQKDFDQSKHFQLSRFPTFSASTHLTDILLQINFEKDSDSFIFVQSMNLQTARAVTIGYIPRGKLLEEFLKPMKHS
eukprot:TRINITY_DN11965_c0_g1_i1.p1 TRINITY_DN11965_c0_g1~~TRINITY_DN11965_c0_g1_i1.p1  ORF type:complete len:428 (-),score=62.54 TRINITY_DN11965_c0_g1_i1:1093-2376(-)